MTNHTRGVFGWYCAGVVSQFVPFGLHNVLYAWMIAVMLEESGFRLGLAQMVAQLPGLVLILFSGLMADRVDRRRILIVFHLLAAIPPFALAMLIVTGHVNYYVLMVFALVLGSFNTFLQPARDSLLNQVTTSDLQRAVTIVMGLSFASQVLGYALASSADAVGPVPLLLVQAVLLVAGGFLATRLPPGTRVPESLEVRQARAASRHLSDIGEGLSLIVHSGRMAPVMILMFAVGIFYVGAFSVINPIVVRDIYGGGSADIALSFVCFMVGTIVTTVLLVSVGGVQKQGLGLMMALLTGGGCLTLASLNLSFPAYLFCIGLWGVCGGVAMSLGRAIIQESAPDSHRARALSVYSLGTLGGMPVGSVLMGWFIVVVGPLQSFLVAVTGVAVTVAFVWTTTDLKRVERYGI